MGLQIEVGVRRANYLAVDHETRPTIAGLSIGAISDGRAMDRQAKHARIEETDLPGKKRTWCLRKFIFDMWGRPLTGIETYLLVTTTKTSESLASAMASVAEIRRYEKENHGQQLTF